MADLSEHSTIESHRLTSQFYIGNTFPSVDLPYTDQRVELSNMWNAFILDFQPSDVGLPSWSGCRAVDVSISFSQMEPGVHHEGLRWTVDEDEFTIAPLVIATLDNGLIVFELISPSPDESGIWGYNGHKNGIQDVTTVTNSHLEGFSRCIPRIIPSNAVPDVIERLRFVRKPVDQMSYPESKSIENFWEEKYKRVFRVLVS